MERIKNSSVWIEEGYSLFAKEDHDGIQIERLARILQLNKSGFYHYFGDLEVFYAELLSMHRKRADLFLEGARKIKSIDPGYFELVVEHATPIMLHMQLIRIKDNPAFYELAERIDGQEDFILRELWSEYLGFDENPDVAIKYFAIVRDMAYARLSFQNLNCNFLRSLFTEARVLMQQIADSTAAMEPSEPSR